MLSKDDVYVWMNVCSYTTDSLNIYYIYIYTYVQYISMSKNTRTHTHMYVVVIVCRVCVFIFWMGEWPLSKAIPCSRAGVQYLQKTALQRSSACLLSWQWWGCARQKHINKTRGAASGSCIWQSCFLGMTCSYRMICVRGWFAWFAGRVFQFQY